MSNKTPYYWNIVSESVLPNIRNLACHTCNEYPQKVWHIRSIAKLDLLRVNCVTHRCLSSQIRVLGCHSPPVSLATTLASPPCSREFSSFASFSGETDVIIEGYFIYLHNFHHFEQSCPGLWCAARPGQGLLQRQA